MHGCVYIWVVVDVGGVGCVFGTFTEQLHPTSNTVSFNGAWTDRRTERRTDGRSWWKRSSPTTTAAVSTFGSHLGL